MKLVNIEMYKFIRQKLFIISLIVITLVVVAFGVFLKIDIGNSRDEKHLSLEKKYDNAANWKEKLQIQMELNKLNVDIYGEKEVEIKNSVLKYRIDNNIEPVLKNDVNDFVEYSATSLELVLAIFIIISATDLVCREYTLKTTKLIYTRPFNRIKIVLSKYVVNLSNVLGVSLWFVLVSFIVGGICFSFKGFNNIEIYYFAGKICKSSTWIYVLFCCLMMLLNLIIVSTIAFFLANIIHSKTVVSIISAALYFFSGKIANNLIKIGWNWVKYSIFRCMKLTNFLNAPINKGESFTLALLIIVINLVALAVIGCVRVMKEDI